MITRRRKGEENEAVATNTREDTEATAEPDGAVPRSARGRWHFDRRMRKRALWVVAGLAVLVLLILAFRPSPVPVETGTVAQGRLEATVNADGVTRVVDRYQVAAPITGRLWRIELEEGDHVAAGEIVARLTPAPLDPQAISQAQAAVDAAESRLADANSRVAQARETMEQAGRHLERIEVIAAAGGVSVEDLELTKLEEANATQDFEGAVARASAAESDVVAARAALINVDPEEIANRAVVNVAAPTYGRVLRVYETSERVVPAGTPLLDVGDARGLELVVDVLSTDAVQIQPGAEMRIVEWGGGAPLIASVRMVEPAAFTEVSALGVEEQRVQVIGTLPDPPAGLGDGYRIEARIVTWVAPNVIKVPTSALFRSGDQWEVFVVEEGTAARRPVQIGNRGVTDAEVLDGLQPGQEVVLFPSDELEDGSRVEPIT